MASTHGKMFSLGSNKGLKSETDIIFFPTKSFPPQKKIRKREIYAVEELGSQLHSYWAGRSATWNNLSGGDLAIRQIRLFQMP